MTTLSELPALSRVRRRSVCPSGFAVTAHRDGCTVAISVAGQLDLATAPVLRAVAIPALRTPGCRRLALVLSGVSFADCAGLAALIGIRNAAAALGCSVHITGDARPVRRLLALSGLDDELNPTAA